MLVWVNAGSARLFLNVLTEELAFSVLKVTTGTSEASMAQV